MQLVPPVSQHGCCLPHGCCETAGGTSCVEQMRLSQYNLFPHIVAAASQWHQPSLYWTIECRGFTAILLHHATFVAVKAQVCQTIALFFSAGESNTSVWKWIQTVCFQMACCILSRTDAVIHEALWAIKRKMSVVLPKQGNLLLDWVWGVFQGSCAWHVGRWLWCQWSSWCSLVYIKETLVVSKYQIKHGEEHVQKYQWC